MISGKALSNNFWIGCKSKIPGFIGRNFGTMSFVISIAVREDIVMAADSRLTLTFRDPFTDPNSKVERLVSVPQTDATTKLFLSQNRIGISTFGAGDIKGVPIAGFIESFIMTLKNDETPENRQSRETE
jgi:hypothetical protein